MKPKLINSRLLISFHLSPSSSAWTLFSRRWVWRRDWSKSYLKNKMEVVVFHLVWDQSAAWSVLSMCNSQRLEKSEMSHSLATLLISSRKNDVTKAEYYGFRLFQTSSTCSGCSLTRYIICCFLLFLFLRRFCDDESIADY